MVGKNGKTRSAHKGASEFYSILDTGDGNVVCVWKMTNTWAILLAKLGSQRTLARRRPRRKDGINVLKPGGNFTYHQV
jgi:hypothetical protein